jgi:hypothetical protein
MFRWTDNPQHEDSTLWTLEKQKTQRRLNLKGADHLGMVDDEVWDFAEPANFLPPVLHCEIGTVNKVINDRLGGFIEEGVEVMSEEEVVLRNEYLTGVVAVEECKETIKQLQKEYVVIVSEIQYYKESKEAESITAEEEEGWKITSDLGNKVKEELDHLRKTVLPFTKKEVRAAKAKYMKVRGKNKADLDVCNHIEHKIFVLKYQIKRAAYHGGKFNGVHCRKILVEGDDIIDDINAYLKSVDHPEKKATDAEIDTICDGIKRLLR